MRAVIDTCVWVSAVRSQRGASFAILSEIPERRFRFGISVALFLEHRAKMIKASMDGNTPLRADQIESILATIAYFADEVPIYYQLRPNLRDENDNMVFECAANYGADAIITHNTRDFHEPELGHYTIEILTPGQFLEIGRRAR
jgi:putative PIN family toxin of toxin-antitoxin system